MKNFTILASYNYEDPANLVWDESYTYIRTMDRIIAIEENGKIKWEQSFPDEDAFTLKNLFLIQGNLLTTYTHPDKTCQILNISTDTGEIKWRHTVKWNLTANFGGIFSWGKNICFGENPEKPIFSILDPKNGQKISEFPNPPLEWKGPIFAHSNQISIQINDHIYSKFKNEISVIYPQNESFYTTTIIQRWVFGLESLNNKLFFLTDSESHYQLFSFSQQENEPILFQEIPKAELKGDFLRLQKISDELLGIFFSDSIWIINISTLKTHYVLMFENGRKLIDLIHFKKSILCIKEDNGLNNLFILDETNRKVDEYLDREKFIGVNFPLLASDKQLFINSIFGLHILT